MDSGLTSDSSSSGHFADYQQENWVWDQYNRSPDVELSLDLQDAYFHIDPVCNSRGTAGVRGTKGFTDGEHYWEVEFLEPPMGTSIMIGVGTEKATLHTDNYRFVNLLGLDEQSWGLSYRGDIHHGSQSKPFCEPFFHRAIIGCLLDMYKGTLTFFKDGINLGVAFYGLDKMNVPLYPMVSSTASETELGLGVRICHYATLQEKCFQAIRRSLHYRTDCVDNLPLPNVMIQHIKEF